MDSPVEVALRGFGGSHVRVVAWNAADDDAYVLLDANATGERYLYGVHCHRRDGRWEEGSSANGPGWSRRSRDQRVGTLAFWGETTPKADRARIVFDGDVVEVQINDGVYLATWWNVDFESYGFPYVASLRIDGAWSDSAAHN